MKDFKVTVNFSEKRAIVSLATLGNVNFSIKSKPDHMLEISGYSHFGELLIPKVERTINIADELSKHNTEDTVIGTYCPVDYYIDKNILNIVFDIEYSRSVFLKERV